MAPTPARLPLFFFQAEDGIRDFCLSRGLGDVYKRQCQSRLKFLGIVWHRKVVLAVSSRAMPWADFQSVRVLVLLRAPPRSFIRRRHRLFQFSQQQVQAEWLV